MVQAPPASVAPNFMVISVWSDFYFCIELFSAITNIFEMFLILYFISWTAKWSLLINKFMVILAESSLVNYWFHDIYFSLIIQCTFKWCCNLLYCCFHTRIDVTKLKLYAYLRTNKDYLTFLNRIILMFKYCVHEYLKCKSVAVVIYFIFGTLN